MDGRNFHFPPRQDPYGEQLPVSPIQPLTTFALPFSSPVRQQQQHKALADDMDTRMDDGGIISAKEAMSNYSRTLDSFRNENLSMTTTTTGPRLGTTMMGGEPPTQPSRQGNPLASIFGPIPQIPPFKRKPKEMVTSPPPQPLPPPPPSQSLPPATTMPSFTGINPPPYTPSPSEISSISGQSYSTTPSGGERATVGSPMGPMHQLNPMYQPRYSLLDFKLLDTLGTGTFGRVYLCQLDPKAQAQAQAQAGNQTAAAANTSGREVGNYFAMKVLKKSEIVRLKQVEHINSEKDILTHVRHPFIVNLLCTFQDQRSVYMLLEYVIGGELFSHLRKAGRFTPDTTRFYASEIVLAIEYLHSQDVIYRDLKPENLLLDATGNIKITDFGFAKRVEDRTWTLCGTPEYLAPEIIQSKGHGKAVDWWALGILIYEMLSGYPPFFDDNPFGIYEKILAGRLAFASHIDPYGKDLIKRLLTIDRTKRLGNLRGGSEDIKRHKWFRYSDWSNLLSKRVPAPFIPPVRHEGDSSMFERYPPPPPEEPMPAEDPHYGLFSSF